MNTKNVAFVIIPLFHKIIKDPKLIEKVEPYFFERNTGLYIIYDLIKKNPKCWNNVTATQLKSLIKEKGLDISDDIIDNIMNNHSEQEIDQNWLNEKFKVRLLYKEIENKLIEGVSNFKLLNNDLTFEQLEKFNEKLKSKLIMNTSFAGDKWNTLANGIDKDNAVCIKTGYKRFDEWEVLRKKRTTCFLGKTNGGKTISLINIATSLIKNGYKVAYISFEVEQTQILLKILSHLTAIPVKTLMEYTKEETAEVWAKYGAKYKTPDVFYDSYESYTSSKLLNEILTREAEVGKFDAIIIDYLSIINSPEEDMYSKGKKISQAFSNYSKSYDWAIITAAQTNRTGLSKIVLSTEDIAESAALLHTFDFIISIIHYKRLIKEKTFAWDLIKARYVNGNNTIGTKTTFQVDWNLGGLFFENKEEENKAVLRTINKDDKLGLSSISLDDGVSENITVKEIMGTTADVTSVVKNKSLFIV